MVMAYMRRFREDIMVFVKDIRKAYSLLEVILA
jgi:hypothetical protein